MPQQWEYETARGPLSRDQLNVLGGQGWELAAAPGLTSLIFKRPVDAGATEDPAERVRRDRAELQALRGS